jgi:hypothetical protein
MHWSPHSCDCRRVEDIASCDLGFAAETLFLPPLSNSFDEHGFRGTQSGDAGLHWTCYSSVEGGVRNVSLVNVERISKGLRISYPNCFRACE